MNNQLGTIHIYIYAGKALILRIRKPRCYERLVKQAAGNMLFIQIRFNARDCGHEKRGLVISLHRPKYTPGQSVTAIRDGRMSNSPCAVHEKENHNFYFISSFILFYGLKTLYEKFGKQNTYTYKILSLIFLFFFDTYFYITYGFSLWRINTQGKMPPCVQGLLGPTSTDSFVRGSLSSPRQRGMV